MSALRALRQLTASSSRALAARSATRGVARAAVAARVAPIAFRAFSVSARRLGEGACECQPSDGPFLSIQRGPSVSACYLSVKLAKGGDFL